MKNIILATIMALGISTANAQEFSGGNGDTMSCTPVYVEVPEYVEVEVPVYLPSEEASEAIWDASSNRLYLYNTQVWEGPIDTGASIGYAVFSYQGDANFKLETLEE